MKNIYKKIISDSLYKNSIYLILSTVVTAVLGFFFWIINARLFTSYEVGIGTTLISAMSLLSSFCMLGLGGSLVKYLPSSDKKVEKINTSFTLIILASIVASLFYIAFLDSLSPKLLFMRDNKVYLFLFITFVIFNSLNTITQNVFVAYRAAIYVFIKNLILSLLKLILPFAFASAGAYGLFISVGVPTTIAFLISILILISKFKYKFMFTINNGIVKTMLRFSTANYVMGLVSGMPGQMLPLLITNRVGPERSAYFYMDMMIASLLYIIPMATSQSLFAEGSHNEINIDSQLKKAVKIIGLILLPAIIGVLLFGGFVLLTFGKEYSSEGIPLLRLLTISSIFVSINYLGNSILYLKHKIKQALILTILSTSLILILSFMFIKDGLFGIGLAWLLGNGAISIYYLPLLISVWKKSE